MRKKRHSAEQIVKKLRTAEVELARGATEACKKLGITDQTYYRWRKEGSAWPDAERALGRALGTALRKPR